MIVETHKLTPGQHHAANDQIYNGLDCAITHEVHGELRRLHNDIPPVYAFELALQAPILEMMLRGFRIDELERSRAIAHYEQRYAELTWALDKLAMAVWDQGLNPNSPKQLREFFYGAMKLPEHWSSHKGVRKLSLNRETLEKLEAYFHARPLVWLILAARDARKMLGTLQTEIRGGRWYTSYNIGGTETGRLSSSKAADGSGSNTQNLKRDEDLDKGELSLRKMFIADKGMRLYNVDLEQTESFDVGYLQGTLLGDWSYLDACERGDLHTQVSRMVWPALPWTGDLKTDRKVADKSFYRHFTYRDMAKRGGHLTNYMGTAWTASRSLKVPLEIMERFQQAYATGTHAAFPAFTQWWRHVAQELQTTQLLTTPYGRRRHFFGRPNDDATLREAIAYVPQSLTADRMNLGLWRIWKHLGDRGIEVLAQVHDSVAFQAPEEMDQREISEAVLELIKVPLTAPNGRVMCVKGELKCGFNWGSWHATHNPDGLKKLALGQRDERTRTSARERIL